MTRIPMQEEVRSFIEKEEAGCIGCKACMKGCPMLEEWCENPKTLLGELSRGDFPLRMPYTCLLCGYCTRVCPKDISFRDVFFRLRQESVRHFDGKLPKELRVGGVRMHQTLSASPLIASKIPETETLFFPGCALLAQSPEIVEKTYAYLQKTVKGLGITNRCCFKPTEYLGDAEKFSDYAAQLQRDFRAAGVKTILTACSNCYMSFRRHVKDIEIRSVYEVLAETGLPAKKKNAYRDGGCVAVHDPCPTRNEKPMQEAVRALAKELGLKTEELSFSGARTLCCGTGGMVKMTAPAIHKKHVTRRAEEGGDGTYLTYCRECAATLTENGRPAVHLLDLLFGDGAVRTNQGLLAAWKNRIGARNMGKKSHE